MDSVSETILALQQRLYNFENEVRRERQSTDRKIKNIEVENKEFKCSLSHLERKIKNIEAENKELKSEIKKLNAEVRKLKEQCTKLSKDSAKNTAAIAAIHRRIILDDAKAKLIKRYPGVSEEPLNPNHYGAQSSRLMVARMKRHCVSVD